MLRRVLYAFLVVVILAAACSIVGDVLHAASTKPTKPITTQDVVIEPPDYSICRLLEPYGYWWFAWGCNEGR